MVDSFCFEITKRTIFAIARLLIAQCVSCEGFKMSVIGNIKCKNNLYYLQFAHFPFCIHLYFCTFAPSNLKIGIK